MPKTKMIPEAALRVLEAGACDGVLRAIVSAGALQREQKAWVAFRELVRARGGSIEPLPDESFKISGTSVRTAVVRIGGL